jgi:hypothetical protein
LNGVQKYNEVFQNILEKNWTRKKCTNMKAFFYKDSSKSRPGATVRVQSFTTEDNSKKE